VNSNPHSRSRGFAAAFPDSARGVSRGQDLPGPVFAVTVCRVPLLPLMGVTFSKGRVCVGVDEGKLGLRPATWSETVVEGSNIRRDLERRGFSERVIRAASDAGGDAGQQSGGTSCPATVENPLRSIRRGRLEAEVATVSQDRSQGNRNGANSNEGRTRVLRREMLPFLVDLVESLELGSSCLPQRRASVGKRGQRRNPTRDRPVRRCWLGRLISTA
jgi:hypothetical protein